MEPSAKSMAHYVSTSSSVSLSTQIDNPYMDRQFLFKDLWNYSRSNHYFLLMVLRWLGWNLRRRTLICVAWNASALSTNHTCKKMTISYFTKTAKNNSRKKSSPLKKNGIQFPKMYNRGSLISLRKTHPSTSCLSEKPCTGSKTLIKLKMRVQRKSQSIVTKSPIKMEKVATLIEYHHIVQTLNIKTL